MRAHAGDQVLGISVLEARLGVRVLDVQVIDRPVQRITFGQCGARRTLTGLLPLLVLAQLDLNGELGIGVAAGTNLLFFSRSERACSSSLVFFRSTSLTRLLQG